MNIRNSKVYYINLSRSCERRKKMIKQLRNLRHVEFDRIEAIDGLKLLEDDDYRKEISKRLFIDYDKLCPDYWCNKKNFRSYSTDPENIMRRVGCWLSHYRALQFAFLMGDSNCLILEDDAILLNNFMDDFEVPTNSDIIYFGGTFQKQSSYVSLVKNGIEKINPANLKVYGLFGYYIPNKEKIQQLYKFLKSTFIDGSGHYKIDNYKTSKTRVIASNIDKMIVDYVQKQNGSFFLLPPKVTHPEFEEDVSTIDNSSKYKKRYGSTFSIF